MDEHRTINCLVPQHRYIEQCALNSANIDAILYKNLFCVKLMSQIFVDVFYIHVVLHMVQHYFCILGLHAWTLVCN